MQNSDPIVGIDLGTTHSVVAHLESEGRPKTISNREGDSTTPSVVFFDPSSVVVGKEAVKAAQYEPQFVAQFAKRDVGHSTYHKTIRGERLPPEVIQALVLKKLKEDAERQIGEFKKVVITVPAFFNEPRRKSTQDAGRLAGLEVLDIINEPTAAAIAYGVQKGFLTETGAAKQAEKILVYDLGGGTFDATLMTIDGHHFNAVATVGDVHLGGIDWDERIADCIAEHYIKDFGTDPREDPLLNQSLLQEAEEAKHSLSARNEVTIHFGQGAQRTRVHLTREQFEAMTLDLIERTRFTINNLLRDIGMEWSELTRVIMVGGSTRMPMIEQMLARETGKPIDSSLSPDESVAQGAAIFAGLLTSKQGERPSMQVTNVNSHDLGVLAFDPQTKRRRRKILIPRNTKLPATGGSRFVTQRQGQTNVKVDVIEGGDDSGNGSTHIGKCIVEDLPPGLPPQTSINVYFTYAENGRLTVKAKLPEVDRQATLAIHRVSGLSDLLLKQWEQRIRAGLMLGEEPGESPTAVDPEATQEMSVDSTDFARTTFRSTNSGQHDFAGPPTDLDEDEYDDETTSVEIMGFSQGQGLPEADDEEMEVTLDDEYDEDPYDEPEPPPIQNAPFSPFQSDG